VALGALLTVAVIAAVEKPWSALWFIVTYIVLYGTLMAVLRVIRSD
jgi:hypothetical protein